MVSTLSTIRLALTDETRAKRVGHLLAVLWILSAADLVFTVWAHQFTEFTELNPLARALLQQNWMAGLILFKFILTSTGTLIFWHLRGHGRAEAALWAMVVVYVGLAIRWSSYTTEVLAFM